MKLLKREEVAPIFIAPGDSISLTWRDDNGEKTLTTHTFDEYRNVDVVAIAEASPAEAADLGMKDAIIGAFGTRA